MDYKKQRDKMVKSKKRLLQIFLLCLMLSFSFFVIFSNHQTITGFIIFGQNTQENFSGGVYANTEHNGTGIVLYGNNLSGNYTSEIIDAGQLVNWNNISVVKNNPSADYLLAVDGTAGVFISKDSGLTWAGQTSDYGDGGGSVVDLFSDGDYIYLLFSGTNKKIYRSENLGVNWTLINDSLGAPGFQVGEADHNGNLFIARANGEVIKSDDNGTTWITTGDINGGSSNTPKGITINSSDSIFIVDGSDAVYVSSDAGVNWAQQTVDYGGNIADDLISDDANDLYILFNRDVYKSIDEGVNWIIVNNTFSTNQDGLTMISDMNDLLYIIDPSGDVFKSEDLGVSWNNTGDFNGGSGSDVKGFTNYFVQSNLTYQFRNCSSSDCAGSSFAGPDGTGDTFFTGSFEELNLISQYLQYIFYFETEDSDLNPYLNNIQIDYDILAVNPIVEITSPGGEQTFGTNESLGLNFSVQSNDLDSCWYTLDGGGNNISIVNCVNTTFDVPGNGDYTLGVYANESVLGLEGYDEVNFSVLIGAPSILLHSPINSYLGYTQNIEFNYTATDIDLDSCSLWGNFSGEFILNETHSSVVSGVQDTFFLNLTEGTYLWNVYCNDTLGNGVFNGNKSFGVDITNPVVSISAPSGNYNSLTGIPLSFLVTDSNPVSCVYNVSFASSGELVVKNKAVAGCNPTEFGVDTYSNYILDLTVNDSAGNVNNSRKSFTVSIPGGGGGSSSGGGSGGGGGGSSVSGLTSFRLDWGELEVLRINRGSSEYIELPLQNKGFRFLNNCHFFAKGGVSDWISGEDVQSLSPGQTANYIFTASVPINAEAGDYFVTLGANCVEYNSTFTYQIEVVGGEFEITILNSERIGTKLRASYAVENFGDDPSEVVINYRLLNENGELIVEGVADSVVILAGERFDRIFEFELPKNSIGDYLLIMEATDGLEITQKQQLIRLTTGGISGFAISDRNFKAITWFGLVVLLSFGVYLALKKLKHQIALRKASKIPEREFITLDLKN
ncbi:hypothetical protein J4416_02990 [Candidatus Pacearchaeota archaeon]|nr:hypothetical protein [Candidatus Pacearchaeota archaeon]